MASTFAAPQGSATPVGLTGHHIFFRLMLAIETSKLTKDYSLGFWRKRPRRALHQLSLEVQANQIFGLLGPNGAGKTTTLKTLLHLVFPTSGTARILGRDLGDLSIHKLIGYLPENPYFYDHLSAAELLNYAGELCGLRTRERRDRVQNLLIQVGLEEVRNLPLRKFSKGMIQRVGIAQALVNNPELVFLDEPMSGLDPLGRRDVRNLILRLKEHGKTVFFSTHILSDAETLCDRVAILDRGRLQGCGDLRDILGIGFSSTELVLEGATPGVLKLLEPFCGAPVWTGERVRLVIASEVEAQRALAIVVQQRARVISLNPIRMSLEDYFLEQVGSQSRFSTEGAANARPGAPREDA